MFRLALGLIAGLTVAVAVAWRFGSGLTVDEPFTANTVRLPWSELWATLPIDNLPFYYLLLKIWTRAFGESEVALRALSALAYGGATALTGLAARRSGGIAVGLAAALLMASSDAVGLEHAATARPYAVLALIAAAALVQSVDLVASPEAGGRAGRAFAIRLGVTHLLGLLTHPIYVVIASGYGAASLLVERRLRSVVLLSSALAVCVYAVVWGPVVRETMALHTTSWMKPPRLADVQRAWLLLWGTGPGFMIAGAILATIAGSRVRASEVGVDTAFRWTIAAAAAAWALPLIVSGWWPVFESTRTPVVLLPATCTAVGVLIGRRGGSAAALALACVCAMASGHRLTSVSRTDIYPTTASIETVLSRAECGDYVIAPGLSATVVEYYFRRLDARSCIALIPFPSSMVNWVEQLQRADTLHAEADRLADKVSTSARTVWLLTLGRGETHEASTIVESSLRGRMPCEPPQPLKGAFFDALVRCRSERDPTFGK